jgi:hypothetical protein
MATRTPTRGVRWESPLPLPRHHSRTFLLARNARRPLNSHWLGRPRPFDTQAPARPRMVAQSPHLEQRAVHLQARRDRLPLRRLQRLRVGGRHERRLQLHGPRFLERCRPKTIHHVEGTLGSATRRRAVSTPAKRTAHPPPRGQHRRGRDAHQAHHPVTRYDDRKTQIVVPTRHQRHPHPTPLHPQPRTQYGGLATQPPPIRPPSSPVETPHYRQIRLYAQHTTPTLQRQVAAWRDPQCEDVDCLRLPDAAWQRKNNYNSPP